MLRWRISILLSCIILLILFASPVFAADLEVDCSETACSYLGADTFFSSEEELWYPGKEVLKTLSFKNSTTQTREVGVSGNRISQENNLENVLNLSINLSGGGAAFFSGTLSEFYQEGYINLGNLGSGEDQIYNFQISMDSSIPNVNEYQGLNTAFSLTVGLLSGSTPTSSPTPTLTPTPASSAGADNNGNGSNKIDQSVKLCRELKPNLPTNLTAAVGPKKEQITLYWTAPTTPPSYTYFLVAYSNINEWPPKWGNPNIGAVSSYIVSGLPAGTYYFWIRAGNGCMPGDFIGPVSASIVVGAAGRSDEVVAVGFQPGVLGEATKSADIADMDSNSNFSDFKKVIVGDYENNWQKTKEKAKPVNWKIFLILSLIFSAFIFLRVLSKKMIK